MDEVVIQNWEKWKSGWTSNSSIQKIDDWSGMQFTTDCVKASLHFTKTNTQPEEEEKPKTTITKLTNGVLVITIGPKGE